MLNQPDADQFTIDDIIEYRLDDLVERIRKEGIEILISEIQYSFLDRVENLYYPSDLIYPNEDLPSNFGVQRGYNGGGIHSGLQKTEIDRMTKSRQAKAERILAIFEDTFWGVLKDIDSASEEETGEPLEDWNRLTI